MIGKTSNPPKPALWLLRHARSSGGDALTGDLIERFHEGQTRGWFWRQVVIAVAVSILAGIRRRGPHFCYAIAGTVMPVFLWASVRGLPSALHWWVLTWPWSQLVLELSATALMALAALPVLAAGLAVTRAFRWSSLVLTGAINLTLITFAHYMQDFLRPWITRPIPGDLTYGRESIIPPVIQILIFFCSFLIAAWLGCRPPQRPAPNAKPA